MSASEPLPPSHPPSGSSVINLLVCSACDHPICTEDDVLCAKLDMPASAGFAYEFDDVFDSPEGSEAPWCYRVNVASDVIFNTTAPTNAFSSIVSSLPPRLQEGSLLAALSQTLAPISDQDTLSLMREGVQYQSQGVGAISSAMVPTPTRSAAGGAARGEQQRANGNSAETAAASATGTDTAAGDSTATTTPVMSPTGQRVQDMIIPPVVRKTAVASTDLIRVKQRVCYAGILARPRDDVDDEGISTAANQGGGMAEEEGIHGGGGGISKMTDPRMDHCFEGFKVKTCVACASCNASLGWGFGPKASSSSSTSRGKGKKNASVQPPVAAEETRAATAASSDVVDAAAAVEEEVPTATAARSTPEEPVAVAAVPEAPILETPSAATVSSAVPAAVRSNPFGPRTPSVFGNATIAGVSAAAATPTTPTVAIALEVASVSTPPPAGAGSVAPEEGHAGGMGEAAGHDDAEEAEGEAEDPDANFICLILKNVKHRRWGSKELSRLCLVVAAVARRQALDLLHDASPAAIAAVTAATPTAPNNSVSIPTVFPTTYRGEGNGDEGPSSSSAAASSPNTAAASVLSAASLTAATERAALESIRHAEIRAILDEDVVSRRRLEALMNARINEAVEERTRHLKLQSELVVSLLEKHKEQTTVLSQLLRGQKEKLRTQEDKLSTYEQIFVAHKRQLDTQTKHITFQDDLMKTLKVQAECQQRQIESQQSILREQNGTIHKQNAHVREMQAYLRSLVESQVRMKQYLEVMADKTRGEGSSSATANTTDDADSGETVMGTIATAAAASASPSSSPLPTGAAAVASPIVVEHSSSSTPVAVALGACGGEEEGGCAKALLPVLASANGSGQGGGGGGTTMGVVGSVARQMLADLAEHEALFGINYSSLDRTSIAGQAMLSSSSSTSTSSPPFSGSPTSAIPTPAAAVVSGVDVKSSSLVNSVSSSFAPTAIHAPTVVSAANGAGSTSHIAAENSPRASSVSTPVNPPM